MTVGFQAFLVLGAVACVWLVLNPALRLEFHWSCPWIWLPPRWFVRLPRIRRRLPRRVAHGFHLKLWNFFGSSSGGYWGVGVLQIKRRHLFAVINNSDNPQTVVWLAFRRIR